MFIFAGQLLLPDKSGQDRTQRLKMPDFFLKEKPFVGERKFNFFKMNRPLERYANNSRRLIANQEKAPKFSLLPFAP